MVRILVIGHGLIGRQRANAVAARARVGQCALAGTVDPQPRAADLHGGAPHFAQFADVAPDRYDAAVIAVPHHLAGGLTRAVLAQRKPVLVEKPLGLDGAEARALTAAARGTASFVGYNYRFLPTFREAAARIQRGELGALRSIDMLLGHGGNPRSAEGWKLDPALAGGGVVLDPGVHLFDLLLCLEPQLRLQHAAATRGFWKTGIEEDFAAVFGHGELMATARVSHIRWINTFRIEIGGDDGYAIIEGRGGSYGAQTVRFGRRWGWNDGSGRAQRETEEARDFGAGNDSLDVEMAAVIDRWNGGAPSAGAQGPATFEDGVKVAELCDEMYQRIGGGAPVASVPR
jgi:predicted dehydrogenase